MYWVEVEVKEGLWESAASTNIGGPASPLVYSGLLDAKGAYDVLKPLHRRIMRVAWREAGFKVLDVVLDSADEDNPAVRTKMHILEEDIRTAIDKYREGKSVDALLRDLQKVLHEIT